jgi:hypothetical protein
VETAGELKEKQACGEHDISRRRRRRLHIGQNFKKKEVTWSELATTLLTMTRKTGLSGTQATTRRRCYLRKIARHTQSAPQNFKKKKKKGLHGEN